MPFKAYGDILWLLIQPDFQVKQIKASLIPVEVWNLLVRMVRLTFSSILVAVVAVPQDLLKQNRKLQC